MLKHILTGQPSSSSAGSRHPHHHHHQQQQHQQHQEQQHQNDYQASSCSLHVPVGSPTSNGPTPEHHRHYMSGIQGRVAGGRGGGGGGGGGGPGSDVYDSVVHRPIQTHQHHQHPSTTTTTTTSSSQQRHSLNHSQLSVNNLSQRLNHSHALNLSTLSTSKHSVNSVSPVIGNKPSPPGNDNNNNGGPVGPVTQIPFHHDRPKVNGGLDISRLSRLPSQATPSPAPAAALAPAVQGAAAAPTSGPVVLPLNASWSSSLSRHDPEVGVKEMLTSLGLLCLVSLLLALLSLIFLLKISPLTVTPSTLISPEEYTIVYEVTLALCALALSLNLCCLLVCAIQFLFAVKLVKTSQQGYRSNKYLQKSSISRMFAVGGFFISIPVFLTGMILYTFIQFHSTPAIVTSIFIGLGIVFCGCAMVHNVFVWQREKTNALKALAREQCEAAAQLQRHQQQHHQQYHHSHQHQQQARPTLSMQHHGGSCAPKIGGSSVTHSSVAEGRSSQFPSQQTQQHHHHHHHHLLHHRHVPPMSPPLSPSYARHQHNASVHRNVTTTTTTPPATPGDRSPTTPSNKFNRSHCLTREVSGSVSPGLPAATLDLSSAATTNSPHELSTLV